MTTTDRNTDIKPEWETPLIQVLSLVACTLQLDPPDAPNQS